MSSSKSLPTIGVLGTGPVGQGLAELLSRADYTVSVGTRDPDSAKLDRLPLSVRRTTFVKAAQADCVFLAVLHSASRDLVTSLALHLTGKLLVDTDNAWLPGDALAAGLTGGVTEGSWMARLLPGVRVTRAFSHIDWDKLVPAATHQPDTWAVGYAADDPSAAQELEALIRALRYVPYRIGNLRNPLRSTSAAFCGRACSRRPRCTPCSRRRVRPRRVNGRGRHVRRRPT